MFEEARLKLTAWYLFIVMLICGLFSLIIYTVVAGQIEHLSRPRFLEPPIISFEIIEEQKAALVSALIVINGVILVVSGGAGYFLAGRTLKPIKVMVDEQNQFISDASHELRTPLATLRAEMEGKLLEKNIPDTDARALINSNLEELDRLQKLSDSLLQLTRIHTVSNKRVEKVSINEIVNLAVKKTTALARKKLIRVETKISDAKISGQKDPLVELLIILLDNAIKYSPEKTKINVTTKKDGQNLIISVQDRGVGISPTDMPHIFERFYRADKSRSVEPGYGLGLSIAKKLVEAQNGRIEVESQPVKGSTFTVTLPIKV